MRDSQLRVTVVITDLVRGTVHNCKALPSREYSPGAERVIFGSLRAGGSGFRHTISNATRHNRPHY